MFIHIISYHDFELNYIKQATEEDIAELLNRAGLNFIQAPPGRAGKAGVYVRNLLGWLGTRPAQNTSNYLKLT